VDSGGHWLSVTGTGERWRELATADNYEWPLVIAGESSGIQLDGQHDFDASPARVNYDPT